jgi:hypothetical protein
MPLLDARERSRQNLAGQATKTLAGFFEKRPPGLLVPRAQAVKQGLKFDGGRGVHANLPDASLAAAITYGNIENSGRTFVRNRSAGCLAK